MISHWFNRLKSSLPGYSGKSQTANENKGLGELHLNNNANTISNRDIEGANVNSVPAVLVFKKDWEVVSEKIKNDFFKNRVEVFSSIAKEFEKLAQGRGINAYRQNEWILNIFKNLCAQLENGASRNEVEDGMRTALDILKLVLDNGRYDQGKANTLKPILEGIKKDFEDLELPDNDDSDDLSKSNEEIGKEQFKSSFHDKGVEERHFNNHAVAIDLLTGITQFFSAEVQLIPKENDKQAQYGGKTGDEIFQKFSESLVIPLMTSLFRKWKENANKLVHDNELQECTKNFLDNFLDIAGKERALIAKCANSGNVEDFGVRYTDENAYLLDQAQRGGWKAWMYAIEEKAADEKIGSNSRIGCRSFNIQEYKNEYGETHKKIFDLDYGGINAVGELCSSDENASSATLRFTYREENNKPMIYQMACFHLKYHKENLTKITPFLIDALQANDAKKLQKAIGGILFWMNHPSHFKRGQAAISELMIKAIAELHGQEMKLVGRCSKENENPLPLDQGILLCSSVEDAMQFCVDNIHLDNKKKEIVDMRLLV